MALIGHCTLNSNKINVFLINRIQKKVSKNNSKKLKNQGDCQKQIFQILNWVCQNVSNEVLLAWFKFQARIPSPSGVYV